MKGARLVQRGPKGTATTQRDAGAVQYADMRETVPCGWVAEECGRMNTWNATIIWEDCFTSQSGGAHHPETCGERSPLEGLG